MDNANFISVPDWACCATTVAAERLILGLVWKLGNPSKNKRAMGFYAKSKWIEERYHLSKNTMLNYAAVYPAAIENGWEPKKS